MSGHSWTWRDVMSGLRFVTDRWQRAMDLTYALEMKDKAGERNGQVLIFFSGYNQHSVIQQMDPGSGLGEARLPGCMPTSQNTRADF